MKLRRLIAHLPLITVLFLMGCSYGCDSSGKPESVYEDSEGDELSEDGFDEYEEEAFDEDSNEEDIVEAPPVIPVEPESVPEEEEGLIDQDDEEEVPEQIAEEGESEEEPVPPNVADDSDLPPDEDPEEEEDFESEEEEYIDDGEIYEDDYPDSQRLALEKAWFDLSEKKPLLSKRFLISSKNVDINALRTGWLFLPF